MISIKPLACRLAVLSLALLASCGDDTVTPTGPGANVAPKPGSSYTFSRTDTDSNNVKVPGSDTTYSMSVVSTGHSYRGKSNLVMFRSDSTNLYVSYESNGDYAVLAQSDDTTQPWLVYPAGSRTTYNLPTVDTTYPDPLGSGEDWEETASGSIAYGGTESITVPAGTFQTHKFVQTMTNSLTIAGYKSTFTNVNTIYFAPSIGWTAKVVERNESSIFPPEGTEEVLTSYTLK